MSFCLLGAVLTLTTSSHALSFSGTWSYLPCSLVSYHLQDNDSSRCMNSSLESCDYLWKSTNEFKVEVINIPASIFLMINRVYIVNEQEIQESVQVCSLQHLHRSKEPQGTPVERGRPGGGSYDKVQHLLKAGCGSLCGFPNGNGLIKRKK